MNKTVEEIGKINFEGNIIPANWYKHITFQSGKPNLNAIVILAEIVYWYRPTIIRDPATGEIKGYKTKFSADKLQRSYQSFADQFGISKRQAQDAIKLLRDLGLITLEFRTITMPTSGLKLTNVMFIEPVPKKIEEITYNNIKEIDNSEHYNTSYDETEEVKRKVNSTTTQRNTSYDRTEEVSTSNAGGQTPDCGTITENTSQTTAEILLHDSASLSSRSSDSKLVTRSNISLQDQSVMCSDLKIDNLSTYIPPKDTTVCILDNKPNISLEELDISLKAPVVKPGISIKEPDKERAIEPVNKPVVSTVAMLEDRTGKILNKSLNEPVSELDIEPEMSFDTPDSKLDISTIESESVPYVEYTDEELEEILKKLNAGSNLNASCSEKKSDFERSGKILNNEQNKPKKDLFKPFSFDDFFGTSDKVAPDISQVLSSNEQNNAFESVTGKKLNNSLNKPEKDMDNASDMPDNDTLSEPDNVSGDEPDDDFFKLDDELLAMLDAMSEPENVQNASLETSHNELDKELEVHDASLNAPEREPERNVIMPSNDLIELENEPAGMDAEQTLQDSIDLQECLCAEDTDILTSAAEKDNCDTDSHVLHVLDKADVNKDSCDAFLSDLSDDIVKILAKDKLSDADIKILEEAGFSVVGELADTMQPDAKNVSEKHIDSTEQDFVRMLEEVFNVKAVDDAEGDVNSASDMPEKHADNTEQELVRMLENAFNAKVVDDTENDIASVVNGTEKREKLHDVRLTDELDALPESLLSEPEKMLDADKPDEVLVAEVGRNLNEPEKVRIVDHNKLKKVPIDETDSKPDEVRKSKVISLADRRYQKSLRQAEKLTENALDRRQSQIAFVNRHTNALQECPSCNADSLTTAVGKRVPCTGFEGLELAVNAGMRKRKSISCGSPPAREILRNLLVVSKQKHRNLTFACEGGN